MVAVGRGAGVETCALLNPMDEPLGRMVGNALEVAECVEVLQGGGPRDLVELTLELAESLVPAGKEHLRARLQDGSAWGKFIAMVEAQGGDASALSKMGEIHRAPTIIEVAAPRDGTLTRLDALEIGRLSTELGAGRGRADDQIDFAVGVECLRKQGEKVSAGDPILRIHSRVTVDGGRIADRAITVS